MGLIDDVDCAVVSLEASLSSPSSALAHLASIPAFAWVTTGKGRESQVLGMLLTCVHAASLSDPILSCRAGKVQRKFVLLAEPGSAVAAVIVELQKFAFVYYAVPSQSSHGLHQACCPHQPGMDALLEPPWVSIARNALLVCRCWIWGCLRRRPSQAQRS